MPKLIVNPTSSARREIKLARTLLSIGRDPSNDLVLPDAMVSRRHAVIECRGNQYYLRDCNSSNGSVVNGDRISERSLRDGDLVAIGTARLLFREEIELDDPGAKVVQHPSAPRLHCPKCRADYRKGDLFCRECGSPLLAPAGPRKAVCASCGTAVLLPARFCNACGARLPLEEAEAPPLATEPPPARDSGPPPTDSPLPTDDGARSSEPAPTPDVAGPPVAAAAEAVLSGLSPMRAEPREGRSLPLEEMPVRRTEVPPRSEPRKLAARGAVSAPAAAPAAPSPRSASRPWRPAAAGSRSGPAPVPAPLGPRLLAALIDGLLLAVLQTVVFGPLAFLWSSRQSVAEPAEGEGVLSRVVPLGLAGLALVLGAAYHVVFWAIRGATPGKSFLGLAVVADDGAPLAWPAALARGVGYALSGAALGVGFVMIAFGGIGLHDRIAGTRVVERRPRE